MDRGESWGDASDRAVCVEEVRTREKKCKRKTRGTQDEDGAEAAERAAAVRVREQ